MTRRSGPFARLPPDARHRLRKAPHPAWDDPMLATLTDLLHLDGHDTTDLPLRVRKSLLRGTLSFRSGTLRYTLETPDSPFRGDDVRRAARGPGGAAVHWVRPELVAEVAFTEWTTDGRLRHPRFIGLRDDKRPRDVAREAPRGG